MPYIIKTKDLFYSYEREPEDSIKPETAAVKENVLKNINLEIEKGSFTAIIGHNGSGKSTLAKLLCAVLEPGSGEVFIQTGDGCVLSANNPECHFDIRKTVGMVFQNPDNQLVATIVEEDVAFAPENMGIESSEIRRRVDDALEVVGLSEYALHDTHRLSGGQKQRVAIAGILAMLPECIIFDESTAMLDPRGRQDILDTIYKLKAEMGITVILITHYMNEAALADRVLVVNDGQIVLDGTPREVFSQEKLLFSYGLEVPQATELIASLYDSGAGIERSALTPEEAAEIILGKIL